MEKEVEGTPLEYSIEDVEVEDIVIDDEKAVVENNHDAFSHRPRV